MASRSSRIAWPTFGRRALICAAFLAVGVLVAAPAFPAPPDTAQVKRAVDELRSRGCDKHPGIRIALRPDAELDAVAEKMARGAALRRAIHDTKYRMGRSSAIRVTRPKTDATLQRMLREEFCEESTDPDFQDIGLAQRDKSLWIVVAAPFAPPREKDAGAVSQRVLQLVNEARQKARRCGNQRMEPAPPLRLQQNLVLAAHEHSVDLARRGGVSHIGTDGSTPAARATRAGYAWRAVAENVAAGQTTPEQAVASWLESPGHCANLMGANYVDMGIAFFVDRDSTDGIYWTQLFGLPR